MSSKYKKPILSFLKYFNNPTLCYAFNGERSSKMINGITLDELLERNEQGKDAYFYVNNGGTKIEQVNLINCLFIDLDVGRDANGNYYTDTEVKSKKYSLKIAVEKFPIKPTFVVETRNGFHVYWIIKNGYKLSNTVTKRNKQVDSWRKLEYKLLNYFSNYGADKWVVRLNQILRLPYTNWYKAWTGLDKHLTKIIVSNPRNTYTFEQLEKRFEKLVQMPYAQRNDYNKNNSSLPWVEHWKEVRNKKCFVKTNYPKIINSKKDNNITSQKTNYRDELTSDSNVKLETFLADISRYFESKGMKHSAAQAKEFLDKLQK